MIEAENNEAQIRQLVENWAAAVRSKKPEAIVAYHDDNIIMYDVPGPLQSKGIEAYKETWNTFFSWARDQSVFDIEGLHVTAGDQVAFCCGILKCAGMNTNGDSEIITFRLSIGLKKINQQWTVLHEHHSIPAK